jgi:hypothetical protein
VTRRQRPDWPVNEPEAPIGAPGRKARGHHIAALGERYSGQDHAAAVQVLKRVNAELARKLRVLTDMTGGSHYGGTLLSTSDRDRAIKAAQDPVNSAKDRI